MRTHPYPNDREAEQAVIGAVFLSPALADDLDLEPDDFYHPAHATVWEAIGNLRRQGRPVDAITTTDQLRRAGHLDKVGGVDTILRMLDVVPTPSHAGHYAAIVAHTATRRRLMLSARKLARMAADMSTDDEAIAVQVKVVSQLADALIRIEANAGEVVVGREG